jgi:hypothetical protein
MNGLGIPFMKSNPYGTHKDANESLVAEKGNFMARIKEAEMERMSWTDGIRADPGSLGNPILGASIGIAAAYRSERKEPDFIWPGFLAGTVGALVAPGATGKSFWALEAAMAVACGANGGDLLQLGARRAGRVLLLAGEDPEDQIINRIRDIGARQPQQAKDCIELNLAIKCTAGKMLNLMDDAHKRAIVEAGKGARLIILDTLSRMHMLDENSNGDMGRLLATLENISAMTGAALLYLHHVSKGSVLGGQSGSQQAARGASILVDNARWCGFLCKMSEAEARCLADGELAPIGGKSGLYVRYGVSKQNYGAAPHEQWYARAEGGVLVPVELASIRQPAAADGKSARPNAGSRKKLRGYA